MAARWNSSRAPVKPRKAHTFETVVGLEMSKADLDALAFIPRFEKALCPH
jgi:hypothetical protein